MGKQARIRVGTRRSELAQWQAKRVQSLLQSNFPEISCELVLIDTTGDINLTEPISDIGGKGVFLKEIEQALVKHEIDIAIHSFKDITVAPLRKLKYSGFILEESVSDAFILFDNHDLKTDKLTIATGSLRRQALCRKLYPNISCVSIRGNIQTRIKNAKEASYDGLMLSMAGLERLGLEGLVSHQCNPNIFVPAPGQGIIAIQQREEDKDIELIIQTITKSDVNQLANRYYQLLESINFNCGIPFGAYFSENSLSIFLEKKGSAERLLFKGNKDEQLNKAIAEILRT